MTSNLILSLPNHYISAVMKEINKVGDCINLGQGNPDLDTPSFITNALTSAVQSEQFSGYPSFYGDDRLKEEIINLYNSKYNVFLTKEEVAIVPGGKTALSLVASSILNYGDSVILSDPYYPDMLSILKALNNEISYITLREENFYLPRFEELSLDVYDKAKLIYLNYPNNPTGAIANDSVFNESISLALKHKLYILHDFAYGEITFEQEEPKSYLSYENAIDVGVELYSFSKAYNMAGMRIASIVGNKAIVFNVEKLLSHFFTGIYGAVQMAAIEAIKNGNEYKKTLSNIYLKRRDIFLKYIDKKNVFVPKSTFYCWVKIPERFANSFEFFRHLLYSKKVAVFPGEGFGKQGSRHVRVSLLDNEKNIEIAAKRIQECYR